MLKITASALFPILLAISIPTQSETSPDLGYGRNGDVLHVHYPPDPVNVRTGNFFLPTQDNYLPCFGFPLEVYRSYNSVSTRNGPFGKGWNFNYDLQIIVDEKQGMRIVEADAFVNDFEPVESESTDPGKEIDRVVEERKKDDVKYLKTPEGKGAAFYDSYRKKLVTDPDFFKRQKERYLGGEAKISKTGKYVSRKRGTTYLEKTKAGFIRTAESGRKEEYDLKGLLHRISDRNNNELTFDYDSKSRLENVRDACSHSLKFTYNTTGKIAEIRDSLDRKLTYAYDKDDRLISAISLQNEKTSYIYDKNDRMTSLTFADGARSEIEYDPKTGYVLKQSGPGKKVTTYTYGKEGEKRNATVEDNEGEKSRYEYIDSQNTMIRIDKGGKKTITVLTACCGKPLSIKNEKGEGEEFRYDERGNLVSKTDAQKHVTTFKYEPRFNLPSEIKMHDGSTLRFVYDAKGNLTYLSNSSGEHVKLVYEKHGKIEKMTNDQDNTIMFAYNAVGKPIKIEKTVKLNRTGTLTISYDRTGEILTVDSNPKNPETVQNIRDTLASFMRVLKPSGIDFEI